MTTTEPEVEHDVWVRLGNVEARHAPPGNRITTVRYPAQRTFAERFADITDLKDGLWLHHSTQPPAWVESNEDQLAELLAAHYGCPVGCPPSWAVSA